MARSIRLFALGLGVIVAIALIALLSWHFLDATPSAAAAQPAKNDFDSSRVLVLVDGDMSATAYADGVLHPIADAQDQLIALSDLGAESPMRTALPTDNTVWAGLAQ